MGQRITIDGRANAAALFAPALRGLSHEELWAALLDPTGNLIHLGQIAAGRAVTVEVPLRRLFRAALDRDAAALIVAHNHPSGDTRPSQADLRVTRQIVDVARALGLDLLDHLIFARDSVTSFRALGLL